MTMMILWTLIVVLAVVQLNVWDRRRRRGMTEAERKAEDEEVTEQTRLW